MTASTEPAADAQRPRSGDGSPTSSSSGTPRAAPRRCTRCCGATRRSTCPTPRSRGSSRRDMRPRFQPRRAGVAPADARGVPGAVRRRAARAARRRGVVVLPVVAHRRRARSPRCAPEARDHRDPARARELPALAAPAAAADPRRGREGPAHGDRARAGARREGKHIPRRSHRPQLLQYSDHVRYVEQLRRYHARVPARADAGADLRRLPRGQRGDACARCCASSTWTTTRPIEVLDANPTILMRSQQLDDLVHAVSVGRGPLSRTQRRPPSRRSLRSELRRRLLQRHPAADRARQAAAARRALHAASCAAASRARSWR